MKKNLYHSKSMDLFDKPSYYKFSNFEKSIIKKTLKRSNITAKYALYTQKSIIGKYVSFLIDFESSSYRRSSVLNSYQIISERPISDIEFDEIVSNFGTNKRRFKIWHYKSIEQLIADDKKYYIKTPQNFINICKKKGFTGNFQITLDL